MTATETPAKSTIMPAIRYQDAPAAIDWLCTVLGFERHAVYPGPNGTIAHAQLTLEGGMVMLGSRKDDENSRSYKSPSEIDGAETSTLYVVVSDADAAHKRAQAAGAVIVRPLEETSYGSREFALKDLEGHTWSLGTYDPWIKHE